MLVHVWLCLVTVAVANWDRGAHVPLTPVWRTNGGILATVGRIAELRLEPDHNQILPMYVVLLLWAAIAVALLQRRRVGMCSPSPPVSTCSVRPSTAWR